MILHTFYPQRILLSLGPINIYWYGFFIVSGIVAGIFLAGKIGKKYNISSDNIIDISFWLIIIGVLGARIYHVLMEYGYYYVHPLDIIKIWQGGLAIHGALITDGIALIWLSTKHKIKYITLLSVLVPAVALGQAIGRWGNYFNQELFGKPTGLPWGIPIDIKNRPLDYINSTYFHPAFLYESIGNLLILAILLIIHHFGLKRGKEVGIYVVSAYFMLYSVLRIITEMIRIDNTGIIFGIRAPQFISALIILIISVILLFKPRTEDLNNN
jgi:phosphatidylglycerol---prolipoprotein diacylglyceryl transferase